LVWIDGGLLGCSFGPSKGVWDGHFITHSHDVDSLAIAVVCFSPCLPEMMIGLGIKE
jgi:hypothetical protein